MTGASTPAGRGIASEDSDGPVLAPLGPGDTDADRRPDHASRTIGGPPAAGATSGAGPARGRSPRPRRGPRPDEIALMLALVDGPRPVGGGPIGRCSKRGWCRAVAVERCDGRRRVRSTLFELTATGRALVGR